MFGPIMGQDEEEGDDNAEDETKDKGLDGGHKFIWRNLARYTLGLPLLVE